MDYILVIVRFMYTIKMASNQLKSTVSSRYHRDSLFSGGIVRSKQFINNMARNALQLFQVRKVIIIYGGKTATSLFTHKL